MGRAVGEDSRQVASPRPPLAATGKLARDASALVNWARQEEAETLVLGLPLQPGGADSKMSAVCRKLGALIEGHGLKVLYVDESMTSVEAETAMVEAGLKGSERRGASDGEAACRILERFFIGGGLKNG